MIRVSYTHSRSSRTGLATIVFLALSSSALAAEPLPTDLYGDPLPARAAVRLGTARYRSSEYYSTGLAFSSDDETLVVANHQGLVFINAAAGKFVRQVSSGGQNVESLRITADGLAALTFGHEFNAAFNKHVQSVQRFDLLTGNLLSKGLLSERIGARLALFPDGHTIATCASNGLFGVWDMSSGKELCSHEVARGGAGTVAVSPSGELVAIGTIEGVYLWRRGSEKAPEKVGGLDRVTSLAFSPDGSSLAESTGIGASAEIVLRDMRTQGILQRLSHEERRPMAPSSLLFTSDGRLLIAGNPIGMRGVAKSVLIWDVATGKLVRKFDTGQIHPPLPPGEESGVMGTRFGHSPHPQPLSRSERGVRRSGA